MLSINFREIISHLENVSWKNQIFYFPAFFSNSKQPILQLIRTLNKPLPRTVAINKNNSVNFGNLRSHINQNAKVMQLHRQTQFFAHAIK